MSTIKAENIKIAYATAKTGKTILNGFNIDIKAGEMIAVLGPNGAGKSSLLRVLSGLQQPTSGRVLWKNQAVQDITLRHRPRYLATLFSNYNRVDGFTVTDLVALGRQPYTGMFGKIMPNDKEVITHSLNKVGMEKFANAQIATLSDGEFRKVMLAKMLAQQAPIMILDEPTTHLDLPSSIEFLKLLQKLALHEHKTIVFSTHNISLVFKMVQRVVIIISDSEYLVAPTDEVAQSHLLRDFFNTTELFFKDGNLIFDPDGPQF